MTTESVAPEAVKAETTDIPATVRRLRETFASGRTRSLEWRKQQLQALEKMMVENEPALAAALEQDLGRKPFEAWLADIASTAGEAKDAAKNVRKWMRRKYRLLEMSQLPGRGWVEYEPYGTVLVIGAWNFPFVLTLGPAVGAIAAGNTVVLKPSEVCPASSALMAELVPKYLDNDAIAVVEGDGSVSQELIAQGFDHICFTGGTEIGRKVYEGAAPHLTPVTLELGGKSPVIVTADADIDVAAKRIAWTKLINSGQICIAPDYVLADAKIRDELVDKIKEAVTTFESENPGGKRIVNERHFARLTASLAATKGDVVIGGGSDASTISIQPTVVVDPDPAEPLMTDEIFGPILPIMTVQSLDDAIGFVNATTEAVGRLSVHEDQEHSRTGDQRGVGRRHGDQPSAVPVFHQQAAVRRRRAVWHGRLPRQVRLRAVQPQKVGDDQADPTRPRRLHLPPVYREGF